MLIMGVALAILVPLFSLVTSYTQDFRNEMRISSLENSLDSLADSADMVYSQGYPAKITTELYLPERTVYTNVTNTENKGVFHVRLKQRAGPTDISSMTEANLTGSLTPSSEPIPPRPGNYKIELKMTEEGIVNVTSTKSVI